LASGASNGPVKPASGASDGPVKSASGGSNGPVKSASGASDGPVKSASGASNGPVNKKSYFTFTGSLLTTLANRFTGSLLPPLADCFLANNKSLMTNYRFDQFSRVWFLTWTCYGQWLPGDPRGFVSNKFEGEITEKKNNRLNAPIDSGRPQLYALSRNLLSNAPIFLTLEQAQLVQEQFIETAKFRNWTIITCAIMSNHVHILLGVPGDPDPNKLLHDLKAYSSRKLCEYFPRPASGTWWTSNGSTRKIDSENSWMRCIDYIQNQEKPLILW